MDSIKTFYLLSLLLFYHTVETQDGSNPFRWFRPDNFDIISDKMDRANPDNCATMSESDLRLPPTVLSQIPKYNEIPLRQWFTNRSKLLHLHNLALNRAFFYSYILQRLDGPTIDPPFLPSLMYYYLSAAADVSSGPNVMNTSAVFMDTNTTYANWYELKDINRTLPLFAPLAQRLDNWNDELNFLRIPTNGTIKVSARVVDSATLYFNHELYLNLLLNLLHLKQGNLIKTSTHNHRLSMIPYNWILSEDK